MALVLARAVKMGQATGVQQGGGPMANAQAVYTTLQAESREGGGHEVFTKPQMRWVSSLSTSQFHSGAVVFTLITVELPNWCTTVRIALSTFCSEVAGAAMCATQVRLRQFPSTPSEALSIPHFAPCARNNASVFVLASSETLGSIPATNSGVLPQTCSSRRRHGVRLPFLLPVKLKQFPPKHVGIRRKRDTQEGQ